METKTSNKPSVYELINTKIVEQLENGIIPWKKSWINARWPQNLVSGSPYRGVNVLLLTSPCFSQNYFLSFQQLKELGGKVKKGAIPCPVLYWKDAENGGKAIPRYRSVYNVEQCEGIPKEKIKSVQKIIFSEKHCEEIIRNMPERPQFKDNDKASYSVVNDFVMMPQRAMYKRAESYFGLFFYQLVHSTGHPKRLNRKGFAENKDWNEKPDVTEKLIAEIGTGFIKTLVGMEEIKVKQNPITIERWLKALKKNNSLVIYAATQAQKAVDYILNSKREISGKEDLPL